MSVIEKMGDSSSSDDSPVLSEAELEISDTVELDVDEAIEPDDTVPCQECGADVPTDATECPACGAPAGVKMASNLPTWESELAFEGMATSDGRYLIPGGIANRKLPLTLMCQYTTAEGHDGAEVCGKLTHIWRVDRPDLGEGVVAIMGAGEFSEELMGPTAAALVEEEVLRGVSVDIAPTRRAIFDANTHLEVAEEDMDPQQYMDGGYIVGIEGEIMGATLVPFPAFADAGMRILSARDVVVSAAEAVEEDSADSVAEDVEAITASAYGSPKHIEYLMLNSGLKLIPKTITASAAGIAPLRPPREWFFTPEPEGKMPLTVTDDGHVFGHLATWDQCHHGFANECVLAKPSRADYAHFHVGALRTREGEIVNVGRIIVGDAGHASISYGTVDAGKHYDKTGLVGAFVRAVDGKYGIWLSGAVRSDCPAEKVRDMMANPPSGDWRFEDGWLELIAALSVPVPGFPVPRYEYALTASADDVEVMSLVATGYYELERPTFSRAEMRKREILIKRARSLGDD